MQFELMILICYQNISTGSGRAGSEMTLSMDQNVNRTGLKSKLFHALGFHSNTGGTTGN